MAISGGRTGQESLLEKVVRTVDCVNEARRRAEGNKWVAHKQKPALHEAGPVEQLKNLETRFYPEQASYKSQT